MSQALAMMMVTYNPYEDKNCVEAFVEDNYMDFDYWLTEQGQDPRLCKVSDYFEAYCRANRTMFSEFALDYKESESCASKERQHDSAKGD